LKTSTKRDSEQSFRFVCTEDFRKPKEKRTTNYSDDDEPVVRSRPTNSKLQLSNPDPETTCEAAATPRPVSPAEPPAKKPKRSRSVEMRTLQAASKHHFKEINCSCKKKCIETISNPARRKIHDEFWHLDTNRRRDFVYHRVQRSNTNESTVTEGHVSRRDSTFAYSLIHPDTNELLSVCKVFFLTTLGFHPKNDAVITSVMASTPRNASTAAPDNRGKHTPSNKMNVSRIRQHILRYYPQVSHYCREHAPNRKISFK